MARAGGLPINPDIVTWARERAGLSLQEALGKFSHIQEWEAGTALPSYPQLEKLADEFKVPVAVFFFPDRPKTPAIRESFRTLPDVEYNQLPPRIRMLLRKAKAYQLNLPELTQGQNPAKRLIIRDLRFSEDVTIDDMATRVREYLAITLDQQVSWSDDESALKAWRKALFDVGIFVFKDAFRAEGYAGFSLYDETFPVIYLNNSAPKTRQMFTLFHELAHLIFETSGIDFLADDYVPNLPARQRKIEVLCNSFAAQFLVPDAAFKDAMRGLDRSVQTAELLAARFHVSREVIFRKFLDRSWITRTEYQEAVADWATASSRGASGGDPYWSKIAYLGREYIALAFSQFNQNRISETQLAEYLDWKPKNLSTLEDYFTRGAQ